MRTRRAVGRSSHRARAFRPARALQLGADEPRDGAPSSDSRLHRDRHVEDSRLLHGRREPRSDVVFNPWPGTTESATAGSCFWGVNSVTVKELVRLPGE